MRDVHWFEALEAAEMAIFEVDLERRHILVTPSSPMGELNGPLRYDDFLALIHLEDRPRVEEKLQSLVRAEAGTSYRDELRTVAGAWIGISGKVSAGRRLVAVLTNETERRRISDARLRAIHELSLSSRSAEIFVSMIAHDLKNPIGVVMGTAHTAIDGPSGPPLRRALERIRSNGARLTQMIQHIRDYARGRSGGLSLERSRVDLRAIVERAIAIVESSHPFDVAVDVEGETSGSWDEARLEHAISTLFEDSIRRAPPASSIRVHLDGRDSRTVSISIVDRSMVSSEIIENAFRPFGAEGAEHGLGLFAARQAVVAHGGDITISSQADGTRFDVRLPRDVEIPAGSRGPSAWDELAALEAGSPLATGVTASLFGALPLYERMPALYWKIFERYAAIFDDALNRRIYRGETRTVSEETRAIAESLGSVGAGAHEVAELHARALKQRLRDASPAKAQALMSEGRLLAFEVMGHLTTWYRSRAVLDVTRAGASSK